MDPIEAKKLALREAVALHAPHTGASDVDVVATAERLYQWLRGHPDRVEGSYEWPVTRFNDTMDWPLVT
jgi:hypothetical protein